MNCSESTANLYKALVAAQADIIHPEKNAQNPHLKNRYADLTSVIDATRKPLAKHGLVIHQTTGCRIAENGAAVASVTTRLAHGESGEWVEEHAELVADGKNIAQAVGSIHTYLRRYQWSAMAGVASEPDDDGEAMRRAQQKRKPYDPANANGPNGSGPPAKREQAKSGKFWGVIESVDRFGEVYAIHVPGRSKPLHTTDAQVGHKAESVAGTGEEIHIGFEMDEGQPMCTGIELHPQSTKQGEA